MGITFAKRVATSAVLLGTTAYLLFYLPPFYFSVEVALFSALGLYEFLSLVRREHIPVYRFFGVSMGLIISTLVYMELGMTQSGEILFLVLGCLFLFVMQFF